MSYRRSPSFEFCYAIARPLGVDPVNLFQLAGLLPASVNGVGELDHLERQIYEQLHEMDEEFKEAVLKTVRAWRLYEELRRGKKK